MPTLTMDQSARLLDAVHLATRRLASLGDIDVVLQDVLKIAMDAVGATAGTIYIHDPSTRTLQFRYVLPRKSADEIHLHEVADDYGVVGSVFQTGKARIDTFPEGGQKENEEIARKTGITPRTMITAPLKVGDLDPIGVVQLLNKADGEFNEQDGMVLDTVCDVSTIAIMHSRLMLQSAQVASLQGMGRAAHDLSNKAGALLTILPELESNIKGLRESLTDAPTRADTLDYVNRLEKTYDDVVYPYTERVYRFARLVTDLAAGKPLEPKKKVQSFPAVIKTGVQYMESQARRSHVGILFDLQRDVPDFAFDDLYMVRIAENLVGNAIKATAEMIPDEWLEKNAGDIDAIFEYVVVKTLYEDGMHVLEVSDKGPGMTPAKIRRVMAGQAKSEWGKASGTGLGTKIVIDLATTHGGRVNVKSKPGQGATFRVSIPEVLP